MNLYLDIETIPAQDPAIHAMIAERVTAPASYKKPETIAKWEAEEKPAAVAKAIADTSFDGGLGEVCCIGCRRAREHQSRPSVRNPRHPRQGWL